MKKPPPPPEKPKRLPPPMSVVHYNPSKDYNRGKCRSDALIGFGWMIWIILSFCLVRFFT